MSTNLEPFDERRVSPGEDKLDWRVKDFDWATLYDRLGESQRELSNRDYDALVTALRHILQWVCAVDWRYPRFAMTVARRAVALAWALDPSYFEESPSLARIARKMGLSKTALSQKAASARRQFNIHNRSQNHGWNFKPTPAPSTHQSKKRKPHRWSRL